MGPIIRRELIELLRTRKALALQVSLALACALLVLLRWPTGEVGDLSGARAQDVLRVFGYGALAGVLLLTPAMPATAVVREKVKGTLTLLLNSPLSHAHRCACPVLRLYARRSPFRDSAGAPSH